MKLSVSNIAWGNEDLEGHLQLLKRLGCEGVEIAPSCIWDEPVDSTPSQQRKFRKIVENCGLVVVGLHSLLYTRPDLVVFGSPGTRNRTIEYMRRLIHLCRELGGATMVFGSPKNRQRGQMDVEDAFSIATTFFFKLSEEAKKYDVLLCIEPLGKNESDFITSSHEGMELVSRVNHPNFWLHLDAKAMITSKENYAEVFIKYISDFKHFHVGDPGLAPPGSTGVDHSIIGKALRDSGYNRFISIEMCRGFGPTKEVIKHSVTYVKHCYLNYTELEGGRK